MRSEDAYGRNMEGTWKEWRMMENAMLASEKWMISAWKYPTCTKGYQRSLQITKDQYKVCKVTKWFTFVICFCLLHFAGTRGRTWIWWFNRWTNSSQKCCKMRTAPLQVGRIYLLLLDVFESVEPPWGIERQSLEHLERICVAFKVTW